MTASKNYVRQQQQHHKLSAQHRFQLWQDFGRPIAVFLTSLSSHTHTHTHAHTNTYQLINLAFWACDTYFHWLFAMLMQQFNNCIVPQCGAQNKSWWGGGYKSKFK